MFSYNSLLKSMVSQGVSCQPQLVILCGVPVLASSGSVQWVITPNSGVHTMQRESCQVILKPVLLFSLNKITLPNLKGLTFVSRSTFCHAQRVHHILAIIDEYWAKDNNQLGITKLKCCKASSVFHTIVGQIDWPFAPCL